MSMTCGCAFREIAFGGEVTVNDRVEVTVPLGAVTLIGPVAAPLGTVVLILESDVPEADVFAAPEG